MTKVNSIVSRQGALLDLGPCVLGENLNLIVARGFANLGALADISAPDVFDQADNLKGTQRTLTRKHAEECFEYAMASIGQPAETEPRCFPEIILNARDVNIVELYALDDPSVFYDVDSLTSAEAIEETLIGVRIRTGDIEDPKPTKNPQVSRVDGNHRLARADEVLQDQDYDVDDPDVRQDFPSVPFSLFIKLNQDQEARLFRDINGQHKGMETAHLDSLTIKISHASLSSDPKLRPLWIANELAQPGRAFAGQVFMGGSPYGVKKATGMVPPIKINALKSAMALQLRHMSVASVQLKDQDAYMMVELLDRYWSAVKDVFPEAWQDKKNYILLQSIGLNAFAKFGGVLMDQQVPQGRVSKEDFVSILKTVRGKVSLDRADYPGVAGAGGANVVADKMIEAAEPSEVELNRTLESLSSSLPGKGALTL
jgi:DGQHR domain-containing protein